MKARNAGALAGAVLIVASWSGQATAGELGASVGAGDLGQAVGAVSANELRQVTVNRVTLSTSALDPTLHGAGAMSNTFGNFAFSGQTMSQNNIASGVNVAQQGAVSVTMPGGLAGLETGIGGLRQAASR